MTCFPPIWLAFWRGVDIRIRCMAMNFPTLWTLTLRIVFIYVPIGPTKSMCRWQAFTLEMEKYSLVDCFAGKAAISRAFALHGYKHATLDLEYGPEYVSRLNHCEAMYKNVVEHKWLYVSGPIHDSHDHVFMGCAMSWGYQQSSWFREALGRDHAIGQGRPFSDGYCVQQLDFYKQILATISSYTWRRTY